MLATRLTANNPRPPTKEAIVAILQKGDEDDCNWREVA
jgi:hypothetical protein